MKVILTQNMGRLGSHGDEITVKPGYARNYLIPQGFAVQVLRGNDKLNEHRRKLYESKRKAEIEANKGIAAQLKDLHVKLVATASKSGKLFGSITPKILLDEIAKMGIEIDKKNFHPLTSIRQIGVHNIKVKLHSQVVVDLKVTVISDAPVEKKSKRAAAAEAAAAEKEQALATEANEAAEEQEDSTSAKA